MIIVLAIQNKCPDCPFTTLKERTMNKAGKCCFDSRKKWIITYRISVNVLIPFYYVMYSLNWCAWYIMLSSVLGYKTFFYHLLKNKMLGNKKISKMYIWEGSRFDCNLSDTRGTWTTSLTWENKQASIGRDIFNQQVYFKKKKSLRTFISSFKEWKGPWNTVDMA